MRLLVLLLVLPALALGAESDKSEAKRLRDVGVEAWEKGEYLEALDDFQRAYALYPSINLRFNIARVLADLGRDVDALEAFESFLAEAKDAPDDARALAKAKIAVLEKRVGMIELHASTPDAEITLDGKLVGKSPLVRSIRVTPGIHQIAAQRAGYLPFLAKTPVLPTQNQAVMVDLKRLGSDKPLRKKWWFWTALGGAAAAAATGIALGVVYGRADAPTAGLGVTSPPASMGLHR